MKKIGILTMYYGSHNYGGLLQAYSLCKKINNLGYNAEQICFKTNQMTKDEVISLNDSGFLRKIKRFLKKGIERNIDLRIETTKRFRENCIPHSNIVYTEDNIDTSNDNYYAFITGSDQVWNMNWFEHVYFLDFVKNTNLKISYAASLGMEKLSQEQKTTISEKLQDYKAISVRENEALNLIKDCTDKEIAHVLDPTLLLDKEDWDEMASEKIIYEPYLFCYFLGDRNDLREIAKEYAKKHSLKLVTIPYVCGYFRKCDMMFGDIKVHNAGPSEFVSLIKHADCVMTDSFHACVFSNIYNKDFFAFQRYISGKMSSRIYTLLDLFDCKERFCDNKDKENLNYIKKVNEMNIHSSYKKIEKEQSKSIDFLLGSLE